MTDQNTLITEFKKFMEDITSVGGKYGYQEGVLVSDARKILRLIASIEGPEKQTLKQFISEKWGDDLKNLSVVALVCLIDDFEKINETS